MRQQQDIPQWYNYPEKFFFNSKTSKWQISFFQLPRKWNLTRNQAPQGVFTVIENTILCTSILPFVTVIVVGL